MGSISDDKHSAVAKAVGKALRGSGAKYDDAVRDLIELCADEITQGLNEGGGALAWTTPQGVADVTRYLAYASAERIIETAKERRPSDLSKYAQACASEVARETREAQEAELRGFSPEYVLNMVVSLPRLGAASALDRVSFDQRNGLVKLIHCRLDHKGVRLSLSLDDEPEDGLLWLLWYVVRLHLKEPGARSLLAETRDTPTGLIIDLSRALGPQPKNKRGEPINLAGPMLVKVFDVLTGLPNNRIPASARSAKRLGDSFNVNRSVIKRWREHPEWEELKLDIRPDGKGGVNYTFDLETLLRSARIASQRRGRRTGQV